MFFSKNRPEVNQATMPEAVINRSLWPQLIQQELQQNPNLLTDWSAITNNPEVQQHKDRTAFNLLSNFLEHARHNWHPEDLQNYRQTSYQLQQKLTEELQVFVEEHHRLQYQARQLEFKPGEFFSDMLHSCEQNNRKEKVLLDEAYQNGNYQKWRVHYIRYQRALLEYQQVQQMQQLTQQIIKKQQFTALPAPNLLGPVTKTDLEQHGFKLPVTNPYIIHPGRLDKLNLQPDEVIWASPRFGLSMPANGYVHPGNQAYANTYQIIAKLDEQQQPVQYWLLSDHYYSDLSLQQLEQIMQHWQLQPRQKPNQADQNYQPTTNLPEQLIMSVVDTLPLEYQQQKPFLTFLEISAKLQKDAQLTPELFISQQNESQQQINQKTDSLPQAAAFLTQIILMELSLCHYLPQRQEYVGQALQEAFEMAVVPLISNQNIEFNNDLYAELLSTYHQVWVLYKLGDIDPLTADVEQTQAATEKAYHLLAQTKPQAAHLHHHFESDQVFVQQVKQQQNPLWDSFHNALYLLSSLPTNQIFSCAQCAGGSFGGLINKVAGVNNQVAATSASSSSKSGGLLGSQWWKNTSPADKSTGLTGPAIWNEQLENFRQRTFANPGQALSNFQNRIPAGILATYFLTSESIFSTR